MLLKFLYTQEFNAIKYYFFIVFAQCMSKNQLQNIETLNFFKKHFLSILLHL